jgi:hypothetical protein
METAKRGDVVVHTNQLVFCIENVGQVSFNGLITVVEKLLRTLDPLYMYGKEKTHWHSTCSDRAHH